MTRKLVSIVVSFVAAAMLVAWAAPGPLDGKSFQGEIKDKGKAHGDKDTFVFADGKFRSTACDAYGYDSAVYTATQEGEAWSFTAETHSPKSGTMTWKGTIKGNTVEGTAVRAKDGKAKPPQVFSGTLKP
jgi:hypothetical protein